MIDPRLIYGGGKVLQSIFGGLSGPSDAEKARQMGRDKLIMSEDDELVDPREMMNQQLVMLNPTARNLGAQADRRYGFRPGSSTRNLFAMIMNALQGTAANATMENNRAKFNRKFDVARELANTPGE